MKIVKIVKRENEKNEKNAKDKAKVIVKVVTVTFRLSSVSSCYLKF